MYYENLLTFQQIAPGQQIKKNSLKNKFNAGLTPEHSSETVLWRQNNDETFFQNLFDILPATSTVIKTIRFCFIHKTRLFLVKFVYSKPRPLSRVVHINSPSAYMKWVVYIRIIVKNTVHITATQRIKAVKQDDEIVRFAILGHLVTGIKNSKSKC